MTKSIKETRRDMGLRIMFSLGSTGLLLLLGWMAYGIIISGTTGLTDVWTSVANSQAFMTMIVGFIGGVGIMIIFYLTWFCE